MTKIVISLSLTQDSVDKITSYSKARGISRSKFVEMLVQKFEMPKGVEEIRKLQKEARRMLFGEDED